MVFQIMKRHENKTNKKQYSENMSNDDIKGIKKADY